METNKKRLLILALFTLMLLGCIFYAPRFLLYVSTHSKADAIVVLLGPDFSARQKEAYELINEGMTDYVIIPAYHKTYRVFDRGTMKYLPEKLFERKGGENSSNLAHRYYEDTHIEVIEAKKTMGDLGLKSAIFVSSPYHMRRIKIMVSKEFKEGNGKFYFVPTRYEKAPADFRELSLAEWKKVMREYVKIIWFFCYFPWTE